MSKKNLHVLVVDDEQELCSAISYDFEDEGFVCSMAFSVADAKRILQERKIDVVLSDVRMPVESGFDLLRFTKTLKPAPVFILMTGYSELGEEDALDQGATGLVHKPFDPSRIFDILSRLF